MAVYILSKSVNDCHSYGQKFRGTFFMAHCVVVNYSVTGLHCFNMCMFHLVTTHIHTLSQQSIGGNMLSNSTETDGRHHNTNDNTML